jgi:hypothetical protein
VLDWHSAKRQDHRSYLSVFSCTDPASVTFDDEYGPQWEDYPWEFEVQQHINQLSVPARPPAFLLLGYDDEGLAAVIEMLVYDLDRYCFICAVAVAHRVSGKGVCGEALDLAPKVMSKYGYESDFVVEGWSMSTTTQRRAPSRDSATPSPR